MASSDVHVAAVGKARRRAFLRICAWLLGPFVLLLAAWFGINATDEELSPEARAALNVPPPPAPNERNGYIDFLALGAVEGAPTFEVGMSRLRELNDPLGTKNRFPLPAVKLDDRIPVCLPAQTSCLDPAATPAQVLSLIDQHAAFLARYRTMREKPVFVDLLAPTSPDVELPSFRELFVGSRLSLAAAAIKLNTGDPIGAVQELERENAFHRKIAVGSRSLLTKLLAYALLDIDAWFAVEIARRSRAGKTPLWARLEGLVREPSKAELDIVPVLRQEIAWTITRMRTRRHVRLSDSDYESMKSVPDLGGRTERPWWDPVAPLLYRPHQSVNLYAVRTNFSLEVAKLPSSEFYKGVEAAEKHLLEAEPSMLARVVLNPVGYDHEVLKWYAWYDYAGRMHGASGVQTLARLMVRLKAAGISKPDDVAAALAGPLGRDHPDPFTGKPMRFDPKNETIGFDTKLKYQSGVTTPLVERYGRMALPL